MREAVSGVKGGVRLFRGSGAAARRYVEADRSGADEYYLGADDAIAEYTVIDASGEVTAARSLTAEEYEGWVDWVNPETGESIPGTPRKPGTTPGKARRGSPLFAEMTINAPKSRPSPPPSTPTSPVPSTPRSSMPQPRYGGSSDSTRSRWRGRAVHRRCCWSSTCRPSRSHTARRGRGDPHRHIHFQIGTRVWAGRKWRALTTAALFQQQGTIRALGTAIIAAHPQLAQTLA